MKVLMTKNTKRMLKCSSLSTFSQFKFYYNLRYMPENLQMIHAWYMTQNDRSAILKFSERFCVKKCHIWRFFALFHVILQCYTKISASKSRCYINISKFSKMNMQTIANLRRRDDRTAVIVNRQKKNWKRSPYQPAMSPETPTSQVIAA